MVWRFIGHPSSDIRPQIENSGNFQMGINQSTNLNLKNFSTLQPPFSANQSWK